MDQSAKYFDETQGKIVRERDCVGLKSCGKKIDELTIVWWKVAT